MFQYGNVPYGNRPDPFILDVLQKYGAENMYFFHHILNIFWVGMENLEFGFALLGWNPRMRPLFPDLVKVLVKSFTEMRDILMRRKKASE